MRVGPVCHSISCLVYLGRNFLSSSSPAPPSSSFRSHSLLLSISPSLPSLAYSGVCAYTPAKYDKDKNMTMGDVTTCERFKNLPGAFPAQDDVSMSYVKCAGNGQVFFCQTEGGHAHMHTR